MDKKIANKESYSKMVKGDTITKSWIYLSIALSFMLCFFAPLEEYFANETEFWFSLLQILPLVSIIFVIFAAVILTVLISLSRTKISVILYGFVFCGMLYFYIQGNYISRNYGVLDGTDIQWDKYPGYAGISLMLLLFFLVLWIIISIKVKEKIYSIGKSVCVFLIAIQTVTLIVLLFQYDGEKSTNVVTRQGMLELSDDANILVFILDRVDATDMQEVLISQKGDQYREILEDFTFYPDTITRYVSTIGALPHILTGVEYEIGEKYSDWIKKGFKDSKIYPALEENGYSVGLYTNPRFLNQNYAMNVEEGAYEIESYFDFAGKMYQLVAFNYMPHQLKKYFYIESSDFEKLKSAKEYDVYRDATPTFYEFLLENGISATDQNKSFRVYHVDGAHPPFTFDETLTTNENEEYDVYDEIAGCFQMVDKYLCELKKNDLYDNSAIIVMADHGYHVMQQNPIFMIKNVGQKQKFEISNVKMSWDYLADVFVTLAQGGKVDDEHIKNYAKGREIREICSYEQWTDEQWVDKRYMPVITEYLVHGTASDVGGFECVEKFPYRLGETLSFKSKGTAQDYAIYGLGQSEDSGAWTSEHSVLMQYDFEKVYENLLLEIEYSAVASPPQRVAIYANRHKVEEFVAETAGKQKIIIPNEFIENDRLILSFELPDSISPKEKGMSADERRLALYMNSITVSSVDEGGKKN